MTGKIHVDIISDIVCPWCIIGYKRLEQAVSELNLQDVVDIEWHPFELNPDMPADGEFLPSYFSRKYGMSPEEGRRSRENIAALGAELGFTFDFFDDMKKYNTRYAHILLDYAKTHGKQTQLKLRLLTAYFSERKAISDPEVLAHELAAVGLDVEDGLRRLGDDRAVETLITHENYWRSQRVSSVPTMIFNQTIVLTGAQSVEVYRSELKRLVNL